MRSTWTRFDRWVDSGPFTQVDLGAYRIVFASVMLLSVPRFRWVDAYPDSLFNPPPGPFAFAGGFPPHGVMLAVEIVLSVSLVALALGYRTTLASATTSALMLYGFGFSYSLGKIDHTIFAVLLPAVLLFARWGDAVSVDALLRRRRCAGRDAGPAPTPQWPIRLLALLVGLGFLTAAIPKVLSGWLDPRTHAVQQVVVRQFYVNDRTELLAPYAVHMDISLLWELADVSAVLIELAVIFAAVSWRSLRMVLACAALFHLGVLLVMNIFFGWNVLVYGAFVSWSAIRGRRRAMTPTAGTRRSEAPVGLIENLDVRLIHSLAALTAVVLGVATWYLRQAVVFPPTAWAVQFVGAGVAVWYLARQALDLLRRRPRRPVELDLRNASGRATVTHRGPRHVSAG